MRRKRGRRGRGRRKEKTTHQKTTEQSQEGEVGEEGRGGGDLRESERESPQRKWSTMLTSTAGHSEDTLPELLLASSQEDHTHLTPTHRITLPSAEQQGASTEMDGIYSPPNSS